jgi:hypothetical protein
VVIGFVRLPEYSFSGNRYISHKGPQLFGMSSVEPVLFVLSFHPFFATVSTVIIRITLDFNILLFNTHFFYLGFRWRNKGKNRKDKTR